MSTDVSDKDVLQFILHIWLPFSEERHFPSTRVVFLITQKNWKGQREDASPSSAASTNII